MKKLASSLGPVTSVIGAQWGDEGKGKVTDILSEQYDVLARAAGGANAGHTIVINGNKFVFHLLPSGALHAGKEIILGSGMVIHLPTLLEEIEMVEAEGVDLLSHMHISGEAHIVFDFHKDIDEALEVERSERMGQGLGTTKRGIGPAYADKASRTGIRMDQLGNDLRGELELKSLETQKRFGVTIDVDKELSQLETGQKKLGDSVKDTVDVLHQHLSNKKTILIEGAQAALLDIDHGTYPYVTSSSTTIAGAMQGLGLPPQVLTSCIGVVKAYCTRVGSGTFPSEAEEEVANRLREKGGEFGATTGRPRRCGWLSVPALMKAQQLNGFTHLNITKLDVLDDEEVIPVAVSEDDGIAKYEEVPGWKSSTVGITNFDDLPDNAKNYLSFVEKQAGVQISLIGTGPGREEMIIKS